jgi:FkbH-like protein
MTLSIMVTTAKEDISAIKDCSTLDAAWPLLRRLNGAELSSTQLLSLGRKLDSLLEEPQLRTAYLSNFILDPFPSYVSVYAACEGLGCGSYVGAYNQYFQEILDPSNALRHYDPHVIVAALAMRSLDAEVAHSFSALRADQRRDRLERIVGLLEEWVSQALKNTQATVVLCNFPLPSVAQDGIADAKSAFGEMQFYYELNSRLAQLVSAHSRVHLLDIARLAARFGFDRAHDPKMYYLAKQEWTPGFCQIVAGEMARFLVALQGRSKKCVVLDLDNTLWGGVLGEEGPRGILIGEGDPRAEAYLEWQHKLKALKERGILLALCSKNNIDDVREAFELRPDMPLSLSDFAAMEINWDPKHVNLQRLATKLNLGVDSFLFIDDNPAECLLVQQMLPGLKTIQLPADPERIPRALDDLAGLDKLVILEADREKAQQYQREAEREHLRESIGDLNAYLHSLHTEITIRPAREEDLDRVHQLFSKTNQFNVTTKRYTMSEIEGYHRDGSFDLTLVSAKDAFGDLGTIGLYLVEHGANRARIDSFVLSCRAMGRGIETAVMNHIKQLYRTVAEAAGLEAEFRPTPKNKPAADFFEKQGFDLSGQAADGETRYRLPSGRWEPQECSWIQVTKG